MTELLQQAIAELKKLPVEQQNAIAKLKLTLFWQPPRKEQISTELGDGVILIKDSLRVCL